MAYDINAIPIPFGDMLGEWGDDKIGNLFQEDTYVGDFTDSLMLNRYAYAKSSPLNYVDLSGHGREYG